MFLLDLFQGMGESVGGRWNWIYFLEWLLLGGSNAEKWGDHQNKKFFLYNSVEVVISLMEKHQGLLKLHELFFFFLPVLPNIPENVLKQILIHKF